MKREHVIILALAIIGCLGAWSYYHTLNNFEERTVYAIATTTRLQIELGERPLSAKDSCLVSLTKGRSLENVQQILYNRWSKSFETYGKATPQDHRDAECMHVYGICKLRDEEKQSWKTYKFYFP